MQMSKEDFPRPDITRFDDTVYVIPLFLRNLIISDQFHYSLQQIRKAPLLKLIFLRIREVNEFFIGEHNPLLIQIPAGVYHGFKCVSEHEAILINTPTEAYDRDHPDEYRVDPHENDIPYDWERKDG